jgi:hypothetical protein
VAKTERGISRIDVPLRREARALPVQLFRIAVGLLATGYFIRLLVEVRDFSALDGLIDHALVQSVYPETRVSLFQAGTPSIVIAIAQAIGLAAALGIVLGWRTRLCAAIALAVAASTYRWNFIVMYLDDAIVHLMLFWLLLLPLDPSLGIAELLRDPRGTTRRWSTATVPGTVVTCLRLNVALIYVLAGLWKVNSPLWRSGYGLSASLRLPVAAMPDAWGPELAPLLRLANWMVMVVEPIMVLPLFLRPGHPLKRLGGALFTGFHLFILVTLGLPYAMFGLLSTSILFVGPEITAAASRWSSAAAPPPMRVLPGLTRSGNAITASPYCSSRRRRIPVVGALNIGVRCSLDGGRSAGLSPLQLDRPRELRRRDGDLGIRIEWSQGSGNGELPILLSLKAAAGVPPRHPLAPAPAEGSAAHANEHRRATGSVVLPEQPPRPPGAHCFGGLPPGTGWARARVEPGRGRV